MLKGISPLLSPDLLKILAEMGHGDELVIGDANYPSASKSRRLVRADGVGAAELLDAILSVLPLDQYDPENFILLDLVPGDDCDPVIWKDFERILARYEPGAKMSRIDRFAFYDRAEKAYATVASGELKQYACVILKKGVIKQPR